MQHMQWPLNLQCITETRLSGSLCGRAAGHCDVSCWRVGVKFECCWSSDVRASRCSSTQGAQEFLYISFQLCIQTLTVALALHILCDSWLNSVQIIRKGTRLVNLLYYHELIIIAEPKNLGSLWIYIQKQQLLISINSISRGSRIWLPYVLSLLSRILKCLPFRIFFFYFFFGW